MAMMEAAQCGRTAVLRRLVADPRMALMPPRHLSEWFYLDYVNNNTLLSAAIYWGHAETVNWLLSHPAVDPSARDGKTLAMACGSPGGVESCLMDEWEAAAAARGEKRWSMAERKAVRASARQLGEKILLGIIEKLLADPRVDPSADDDAALGEAAAGPNRSAFFRLLRDPRVNPANPRRPAVVLAAGGGDTVILRHLLADPRVDPSAVSISGGTALARAASCSNSEAVTLLLADPRIDPAADENLAFRLAAKRAPISLIELLLADPRVDPAAKHNAALRVALDKQSVSVVERLLRVDAIADSVEATLLQSEYALGELLRRFVGEEDLPLPARIVPMALRRALADPKEFERRNQAALRGCVRVSEIASAAWARRRAAVLARALALEED